MECIKVGDGFILVDDSIAETGKPYWGYGQQKVYIKHKGVIQAGDTIIFATSNLNIEGVPVITEEEIDSILRTNKDSVVMEQQRSSPPRNKLFIHEGKGHYIGSCVIVVSDSLENAETLIRSSLNNMGLRNEQLSIVEKEISCGTVVVEMSGDY